MANLSSVTFKENKIVLGVELTQQEYSVLDPKTRELLIIPANALHETLTTGKLGNSNRIMFPNKMLKRYGVAALPKKVPSTVVRSENGVWLIINIEQGASRIPQFSDAKT